MTCVKCDHTESIMTPKFQGGATCTKGPYHEMLACESTTPRCNLHLEDKPTVRRTGVKSEQQR